MRGKALPKSSGLSIEARQEVVSESVSKCGDPAFSNRDDDILLNSISTAPATDASESSLDPQTIAQNIAALKARQKAGLVKKGKAGTKLAVPSGSEADGSE